MKRETIAEFSFAKGTGVAFFAGIMSACFAFAIAAGKDIAKLAETHGTKPLWVNGAPILLIFVGGAAVNLVWCLVLNVRNGTGRDYVDSSVAQPGGGARRAHA